MAHTLHVLPDVTANAAQNMAYDFLMLQRYQPKEAIRFRHYDWTHEAFTFGLSQKFSYIQSEVPSPSAELCRRPTGGGIVDHTEDWTYSLVIPSDHPMSRGQPIDTYRSVHEALVGALEKQGVSATLNLTTPENATPGVCFSKPELYDVVLKDFPTKVAGAAQKRTKAGFLMQGSIWKPIVSGVEWNRFYNDLIIEFSTVLDASIEYCNAPNWEPSEEEALLSQFESEGWNQRR